MLTIASGIFGFKCVSDTIQTSMSLLFKSASSTTAAQTLFLVLARLHIFVNKNFGTANSETVCKTGFCFRLGIGTRFFISLALIDELTSPRILKITGIDFSSRLSPEDTLPTSTPSSRHQLPPRQPLYRQRLNIFSF